MTDSTLKTDQPEEDSSGFWATVVIATICSVAVSVAALVVYNQWFKPKVNFGFVDVALVNDISQLVFTDKISAPGITDQQRGELYDYVKKYGSDLTASLDRVQKECNCVLMTKAAMIVGGSDLIDYTPSVLKDLQLDNINTVSLQRRVMDNFANAPPDKSAKPPTSDQIDLSAFQGKGLFGGMHGSK